MESLLSSKSHFKRNSMPPTFSKIRFGIIYHIFIFMLHIMFNPVQHENNINSVKFNLMNCIEYFYLNSVVFPNEIKKNI